MSATPLGPFVSEKTKFQMAFDAGLDTSSFHDAAAIDKLILQMEEHFDLVLISEQMERSLVLLADMLCWPMSDVVSLGPEMRPTNRTSTLSNEQRLKLRALNAADVAIYEHFAITFQLRVRRFGEQRMADGLKKLRTRSRLMAKKCDSGNANIKADALEICKLMVMPEEELTNMIRQKQVERFEKYANNRTTQKATK